MLNSADYRCRGCGASISEVSGLCGACEPPLCACPARHADSCALLRFPMTPREERDPCGCPCHDDTDADEWWWERSDSTTLRHLLDVLADLDDDALALYGLRADATAPLDEALFAWRRAGCPR